MANTLQAPELGDLPLEGCQLKEVAEMLKDIHAIQIKQAGASHTNVARAACVLSLLFVCLHDAVAADQLLQDAKRMLNPQIGTADDAMLSTAQRGMHLLTTRA